MSRYLCLPLTFRLVCFRFEWKTGLSHLVEDRLDDVPKVSWGGWSLWLVEQSDILTEGKCHEHGHAAAAGHAAAPFAY